MLTGVVEVGLFCGMAKAAYFGNEVCCDIPIRLAQLKGESSRMGRCKYDIRTERWSGLIRYLARRV